MNLIPKLTVAISLMVGAMMATSCADDIETDINTDPTGNAISFAPAVGHSTRATETTIDNLGDFAVVARGMHHDGVLYDNYLIGDANGGEIAKFESFDNNTNPTKGTWTLSRSVYWPSALEKVLFFAYTTLKKTDTSTDVFGDINTKFGFIGDNPYIKNYSPCKDDVSTTPTGKSIWADGKDQKDLLVAFTQQTRAISPTYVAINFDHALTQISITAYRNNPAKTDHRIVKIKGAWIYNVSKSGDLKANITTGTTANANVSIENGWETDSYTKTGYGSFYTDIIQLDKDEQDIIRNMSMMLVPEDLEGWNKKNGPDNNDGAFILLLCRVELEHDGANHTGTVIGDIAINGDNHYHQLFPVNETEYNGAQYGFVCVPLSTDWNSKGMGKHYTYKLDICGYDTGAGRYPPTKTKSGEDIVYKTLVPENTTVNVFGTNKPLEIVTTIPSNKKVGDPVLDDPIQFTVTVSGWSDQTNWTPGKGPDSF